VSRKDGGEERRLELRPNNQSETLQRVRQALLLLHSERSLWELLIGGSLKARRDDSANILLALGLEVLSDAATEPEVRDHARVTPWQHLHSNSPGSLFHTG
jgi:hypothetical protein